MRIESMMLIKGVDERVSKTNGKLYKNILLYGLEGRPLDIQAGCNEDDALFQKVQKALFQKCRVLLEVGCFEGRYNFSFVAFEPVSNKG